VPNEKYLGHGLNAWTTVSGTATYVVAPENRDLKNLKAQLKFFCEKYIDSEPGLPKGFKSGFELQPLSDIHFNSTYGGSAAVKAINTSWLWLFGFIGISVLALACINFINLSTAQAISRAKEIGIRKSIGAGRLTLIAHFLKESFVLCFGAAIIALAIVQLILPSLNNLLEKGIQFDIFSSPLLIVFILLGVLLVSFFAGIYPAWVITRFKPALALKSIITKGGGLLWIRKALVVTQFTISVGLLIALVLMAQQVRLLLNKNLGFERENIINVPLPKRSHKTGFLSNELNKIGSVKDFSFATATPSNWGHWMTEMSLTDKDDPNRKSVTMIMADENYPQLYNLKLLSGRFNIPADTNNAPGDQSMKVVVNETLVKTLGFDSNDTAIGKRFWCGMNSGKTEIVGVMADFNTASLHEAIPPTFIMPFPNVYSQVGIKFEAYSDVPETISNIKKAWERTFADGVFEFQFLDQQINDYYKSEMRLYTLFKIFVAVAMFISCVGLWGLSTYAAQQRTKEIGIRKVLGASVQAILTLLSKEFLVMIIIAILIASPIAYYLMSDWLQTFAYKIEISWTVFVAAGIATSLIALGTVGFQAIKAAIANPVDSLKSE
jgi:ABC-type antimicrobial peptide transport system permease subunit